MLSKQNQTTSRRCPPIGRFGLALVPGLMAGLLMSGAALAGQVFEPVSAGELAFAQQGAQTAYEFEVQHFARLNRAELDAHMMPLGMDRARDRRRQALGLDGRVDMALAPGVAVALQRSDVERVPGGGVLWSADVLGGGTGSFLIEHGQLFGQIEINGKFYKVEPIEDDLHRITEIDADRLPSDIHIPVSEEDHGTAHEHAEMPVAAATDITKIRVLIAYTTKAKNGSGDIVQEIKFAIAWANRAFRNSGAKIRFRLARTTFVDTYDEDSTDYVGNLTDLKGGTAFKRVRRQRNKTNADLVALIREGGLFCGVGYVVTQPTASTADWGFSVTTRVCMPSTFAHETGHNMGLYHDRYVSASAPNSVYNYGYVNLKARIRTIMAYNTKCTDNGTSCTRIQYYSTPRKTFNGAKIGKAAGKRGAADAARHLNKTGLGVANYR